MPDAQADWDMGGWPGEDREHWWEEPALNHQAKQGYGISQGP